MKWTVVVKFELENCMPKTLLPMTFSILLPNFILKEESGEIMQQIRHLTFHAAKPSLISNTTYGSQNSTKSGEMEPLSPPDVATNSNKQKKKL